MRGARDAIRWGRDQVNDPVKDFTRLCLQFVRMSFELPAVHPDAGTAWDRAEHKHRTADPARIPAGVPVFWELSSDADHVALSIGNGLCLSNDVKRPGRIDVVRIDAIGPAWNGQLLGWTEDLNGYRVWSPPAPVERPDRMRKARAQLRLARVTLRKAAAYLEATDDDRTEAHRIADQLDKLDGNLQRKLDRLRRNA